MCVCGKMCSADVILLCLGGEKFECLGYADFTVYMEDPGTIIIIIIIIFAIGLEIDIQSISENSTRAYP